jgi:ABC-type multidrug transport system fused ATPase/permease subunit
VRRVKAAVSIPVIGSLNGVSAGAWFLFLQSLDRFFTPIFNLSAFWAQVQQGLSAAERVFALVDAESRVVQLEELSVPHRTFREDDNEN